MGPMMLARLAEREAFIGLLTQPTEIIEPTVCEDCRYHGLGRLAAILYDGQGFCLPHAYLADVPAKVEEFFA
jgi:hypothetical protein